MTTRKPRTRIRAEAPTASEGSVRKIRTPLLRWYDRHRRDLPWRRSRDPYAIWISETMLQQTRVETVIPYYERFLERFPDVATLASADQEQVYEVWTGLGYYSRARNLQRAAQAIVEEFGGELPSEAEALRTLTGIGRYTAGAIASIAFDRPEPIADGNVIRVLARVLGLREDVGRPAVIERIWTEAEALVQGRRPGDLNQALMELGALVCIPKAPRCLVCPIATHCDARAAGDAESLPIKAKKKAAKVVHGIAVHLERRGRLLMVRRPDEGLLAGMWELPGGELAAGEQPEERVGTLIGERMGLALEGLEPAGSVTHLFTHRRLTLHVFRAAGARGRIRRDGYTAHRWVAPKALETLPHAGPTRKALTLLGVFDDASARRARRSEGPRPPAP